MSDEMSLKEWIRNERSHLWDEFILASYSAARRPEPDDPEYVQHWSINMLNKVDRIREADELLGDKIGWRAVPYPAFPFYRTIEGEDLPDEAWDWYHKRYPGDQMLAASE